MRNRNKERHTVILMNHRDEQDRHFEEYTEHRFNNFNEAWSFVLKMGKHARIFDFEGCEVYDHDPANKTVKIDVPSVLHVHVSK